MKRVDAAWLAAALDGEGSVSCTVERKATSAGSGRPRKFALFARVRVQIANDHRPFVQRARDIAQGGYVTNPRKRVRDGRTKIGYQWVARTPGVIERVLRGCWPFLLVKRERARVILRFIAYYRRLLSAPLLDGVRTIRARGTLDRKRLPNRGHRSLCVWLARYWFPRFPSALGHTSSARLCREATRQLPLRLQLISYRGKRKHISEWARRLQLSLQMLRRRLAAGWSVRKAFETPSRKGVR